MPGFLIYVPGPVQGNRQERLREVGLECWTGPNLPTVDVAEILEPETGPDGGGSGLLLRLCHGANHPLDPPLRYRPDLQEWTPAKPDPARGLAAGRFWLGRMRDGEPPLPAYLARPKRFAGYGITLRDGQQWDLPVCRWLPQNLDLDDEGNWTTSVKAEHREFWESGEKLFQASLEGAAYRLDYGRDHVLQALALNYAVNRDIVAWLGLLDEALIPLAVGATLERDQIFAIMEAQKKRNPEPPSTSPSDSNPASSSSEPGAAAC